MMTSFLMTLMTAAYVVVTSMSAPTDVTCIHGNVTYKAGQMFKPDACTTCHCARHSGGDDDMGGRGRVGGLRPLCVVEDCTATAATLSRLNCRMVKKRNECCARCEEPGCLYKGRFYPAGAMVSATHCERCWCPAGGRGHVVCSGPITDRCPSLRHVNCVDYVTDPVTCCRTCPRGANCWLGDHILPQGDIVDVGACHKCQCPHILGQVMTYWRRVKGRQAVCSLDKLCQLLLNKRN